MSPINGEWQQKDVNIKKL